MSLCNLTQPIDGTECIGDSLYNKINPNFENLDNAVCSLSSTRVMKSGDSMTGPLVLPGNPTTSLQAATKQYVDSTLFEPLVSVQFNHRDNVNSIIAQGVYPIQGAAPGSFFPDTSPADPATPAYRVSTTAGVGRHWLLIECTPQRSNYILGEINFPIRACCGQEDETTIFVFDVSDTSNVTIASQQLIWNATSYGSTGATIRTAFKATATPGIAKRFLVTTQAGTITRNTTYISANEYIRMRVNSITGNGTPWDSAIINLTNSVVRLPNVYIQVNGFKTP